MSTAEIESALILHPGVAETAVVGIADEMSGQAICSFVCMKPDYKSNDEGSLIKELTMQVRKNIGPFAAPKSEWDSEVLTKLTVCCQKSTSSPTCQRREVERSFDEHYARSLLASRINWAICRRQRMRASSRLLSRRCMASNKRDLTGLYKYSDCSQCDTHALTNLAATFLASLLSVDCRASDFTILTETELLDLLRISLTLR